MGAKSAKGTGAKDTGAKGAKGGSSSNVGGENTVDSAHELLQAVAQEIFSSKKCVIVTGAGISASAGIPTFRDKDGFFQTIKKKYQGLHLGTTDIMDYTQCYPNRVNQSVPHKMTILHHNVMMDLKALARTKSPTPFHWFIDFLDSKGILLRHYDQNIDGLIEKLQVFLSFDKVFYKVVQCHGTLTCLQCRKCRSITFDPPKEKEDVLRSGELPTCDEKECSRRSSRLNATLREIGFARLRINVALYRESADHFLGDNAGDVAKNDLREKPDLLLVVGTSLNMEAAGTIKLVSDFCRQNTLKGRGRKRIFLNPEAPPSNISSLFDVWVCGRADDFIERLRRMAPDGNNAFILFFIQY
ncbi:DHS-like NAD/FAD-binding domain-containing protein [Zopfochytrium polystomum]|nr:DHS-like NAD/FAD-binding domain-containing protein [Zopfochytrium polystomum]